MTPFLSKIAGAAVAATLAAATPAATPAAGQTVCTDRDQLFAALEDVNAEKQAAIALTSGGALVDLLVAPGGDWTLLITMPGGETCLLAAGTSWEGLPVVVAAAPDA